MRTIRIVIIIILLFAGASAQKAYKVFSGAVFSGMDAKDQATIDKEMTDAIVRLTVEYPRQWESLIDDGLLRAHTSNALEFRFIKRPLVETRVRLPQGQVAGSLSALELMKLYLGAAHTPEEEQQALLELALGIVNQPGGEE